MSESYQFVFFILQIIALYFLSHKTTNEFFYFLRTFTRNQKTVFVLVSVLFFPGTVLHEMAHYFFAVITNLRVKEVKLFPEFNEGYIKLGRVLYEKKDFVRGLIVGIAPIIIALFFFWWLGAFRLFPNDNLYLNLILGYLVFAVSSTMFSSKQDLVDLIYIIPLIIIIGGAVYIFGIRADFILKNDGFINKFISIIKTINFYLLFSLVVNILLILFFKSFKTIIKK